MQALGVFGGTFNPIHNGHLRIALDVYQDLGLDKVLFVPCARPPHREQPEVSAPQRLKLLRRAIESVEGFECDARELNRSGPSYTVDTLRELRHYYAKTSLNLIVGSDSFQNLDTWHQWEQIPELANIIVASRPGWGSDEASDMGRRLHARIIQDPRLLRQEAQGQIMVWPVTQLGIEASKIRQQIKQHKSVRFLLPQSVLQIIESEKLYC
ncbi:MAG: nicotinate-nucleotide adenylyltransferase [Gammaproteobacteria bacterium]|nr:nicotinate-nucleotide adenylyltransferase [Gammaproteobacteria bacterium]